MLKTAEWDWATGEKRIPFQEWRQQFGWVEEPYAGPDGEKVAAIVNLEEGSFGVCVNGEIWEESFEKARHLRFSPDGRLTALVAQDDQWTLAVDGVLWAERFDFAWQPLFSADGGRMAIAFQQEMQYGMAVEDVPWEQRFANISDMTLSPDGMQSAAVVQTESLNDGEIFKFEAGVFTAAINGNAWHRPFMNVWGGAFSDSGDHFAAQVRLTRSDYTIAVDGTPWDAVFSSVWEPVFNPVTQAAMAPVRLADGWTMAENGRPTWRERFVQCWQPRFSPDGNKLAAIVSPTYGKWTLAINGTPWRLLVKELLTDVVFSGDSAHVAACAKSDGVWTIVVDDRHWENRFDRAWPPVFSPDGGHIAVKMETGGYYMLAFDDRIFPERFSAMWNPVFSPDGAKLMLRFMQDGQYHRRIVSIDDVLSSCKKTP